MKLKIGSHKVGTQKTCPYCGIDFVVPEQGNEELPVAQRYVDGVELPNPSEVTSRDTESKSKGAASPSDFGGMVAAPPIGTEDSRI